MEDDYIEESEGESSWPSAAAADRGGSSGGGGGSGGYTDIRKEIFDRLMAKGIEEVVSDPSAFRDQLHRHFERLPARSASCHLYLLCSLSSHLHASLLGTVDFHFSAISSYSIDLDVEKPEDVLLHRRILDECANNPDKRPIFHARFLRCIEGQQGPMDSEDKPQGPSTSENGNSGGSLTSTLRDAEFRRSEPCERMLEDLSLERRNVVDDSEDCSVRRDKGIRRTHEIIFSTNDKPKLLTELSTLLSTVGLNICEAHVFSTTDGFCLDIFVVDGWDTEETDGLLQKLKETAARSHASLLNPTNSAAKEKIRELQEKIGDSNVDRNFLQIREKIASGSSGDLFRGNYHGMDVAIKFLRAEHVNDSSKVEFLQEITILK